MRAKTKKDIVLQLIIVAIILPLLFWWHPTGPYRVLFKWGAIGLSALLYPILNRLWKWKEADEDETPLWYEKKQKTWGELFSSNDEKPTATTETAIPVTPEVEKERNQRDRRSNLWLIIAFAALALLITTAVLYHVNRPGVRTGNQVYINAEAESQPAQENVLQDGTFTYTGEWKGGGMPQECRLEFTVKDGMLSNAVYTNVNYNVSIPLLGKVVEGRLVFQDLSGGQSLMLDLSFPYESIAYIEGYGMDYEHENQTSQLVLRRVVKVK